MFPTCTTPVHIFSCFGQQGFWVSRSCNRQKASITLRTPKTRKRSGWIGAQWCSLFTISPSAHSDSSGSVFISRGIPRCACFFLSSQNAALRVTELFDFWRPLAEVQTAALIWSFRVNCLIISNFKNRCNFEWNRTHPNSKQIDSR